MSGFCVLVVGWSDFRYFLEFGVWLFLICVGCHGIVSRGPMSDFLAFGLLIGFGMNFVGVWQWLDVCWFCV